jgi:hypothetical protein
LDAELVKKTLTFFGCALIAAGCVSTGQEEFARLQNAVSAATAVCESRSFPSASAYGRCLNEAEAPLSLATTPNSDLSRLFAARRTAILERVDRKQITRAQAGAELAQLQVDINNTLHSRNHAAQMIAAQQEAAIAASTAALIANSRPVTCYNYGYAMQCF